MTVRQRLGAAVPYIILTLTVVPIFVGYFWLILNSFSVATEGLRSTGFTLDNWGFLSSLPLAVAIPASGE